MNLNQAIRIIQEVQVSHTINLYPNNIVEQGAMDLAEQLKDSKVYHTINLSGNSIGDQGISAL